MDASPRQPGGSGAAGGGASAVTLARPPAAPGPAPPRGLRAPRSGRARGTGPGGTSGGCVRPAVSGRLCPAACTRPPVLGTGPHTCVTCSLPAQVWGSAPTEARGGGRTGSSAEPGAPLCHVCSTSTAQHLRDGISTTWHGNVYSRCAHSPLTGGQCCSRGRRGRMGTGREGAAPAGRCRAPRRDVSGPQPRRVAESRAAEAGGEVSDGRTGACSPPLTFGSGAAAAPPVRVGGTRCSREPVPCPAPLLRNLPKARPADGERLPALAKSSASPGRERVHLLGSRFPPLPGCGGKIKTK